MKANLSFEAIHFIGIFGSGMSAIAQYLANKGLLVTGSDRLQNSSDAQKIKQHLIDCGCTIYPQDGTGITEKTEVVCISTAIEETNPDIAAAKAFGIPILHRSDILAMLVKGHKSVAIAGTSGKSTVTAMVFELLTACGMSPSLISGAALRSLEEKGMLGNAYCGESDLLVIEADESDGSLVKYHPYASVVLNLSKDHKPEEEVLVMFETLLNQSQWSVVNADDPKLHTLNATTTFGFNEISHVKGVKKEGGPFTNVISVNEVDYTLPVPGEHNASNLLAALSVCKYLGCNDEELIQGAMNYKGVDRRFAVHQTNSGVTVIDDFAHNPEKIRAAINAAKELSEKLIVLFQPHGYGPTRFLRNEYAQTFNEVLRPTDTLCLLPIYYAGGTAVKNITSQDIIDLMKSKNKTLPFKAVAVAERHEGIEVIQQSLQTDSCILLMGARDPSLASFVKNIIDSF